MWNWLLHLIGVRPAPFAGGGANAFWSGFGSDLGEVVIIGGMVQLYRKHTCHVDSPRFCWRLGTHPVDGTPYRVCKTHHPRVPDRITAEHIKQVHQGGQL